MMIKGKGHLKIISQREDRNCLIGFYCVHLPWQMVDDIKCEKHITRVYFDRTRNKVSQLDITRSTQSQI